MAEVIRPAQWQRSALEVIPTVGQTSATDHARLARIVDEVAARWRPGGELHPATRHALPGLYLVE